MPGNPLEIQQSLKRHSPSSCVRLLMAASVSTRRRQEADFRHDGPVGKVGLRRHSEKSGPGHEGTSDEPWLNVGSLAYTCRSSPQVGRQPATHFCRSAAQIARPTAAVRGISATVLPCKRSFDASQQSLALSPSTATQRVRSFGLAAVNNRRPPRTVARARPAERIPSDCVSPLADQSRQAADLFFRQDKVTGEIDSTSKIRHPKLVRFVIQAASSALRCMPWRGTLLEKLPNCGARQMALCECLAGQGAPTARRDCDQHRV